MLRAWCGIRPRVRVSMICCSFAVMAQGVTGLSPQCVLISQLRNHVRGLILTLPRSWSAPGSSLAAWECGSLWKRCTLCRRRHKTHLVRNALRPVARRDAAAGLRTIYTAPTAEAAFDALAEFSASPWGRRYPQAARVFEAAWDAFIPFLAFSPAVRKLLYTTNAIVISSLN
jgi:Transposase, Mutator family